MQQVKKTAEYTIYQKTSGRYAVKGKNKKLIHGEDKVQILLTEALIKRSEPKPAEPEPEVTAETETVAATDGAAEAPAES